MSSYKKSLDYAKSLGDNLIKFSLEEFFNEVHNKFYPEIDISFMKYFSQIIDDGNEFVIYHEELIKYGIMSSERSISVKDKLELLDMQDGKDYIAKEVLVKGDSECKLHKQYYLTLDSFKKCLMKAEMNCDQTADPTIYCDYYILLEKIYKLYSEYQKSYIDKLLSMKDGLIDEISKKIDEQSKKIDERSAQIKQLLDYAGDAKTELGKINTKLVEVKTELVGAKSILDKVNN